MDEYSRDVAIDHNALDIEWIEQPSLMLKYGRKSAEARRSADLAKEELEVTKASLDSEIRSNPEKFGLAKVTEGSIQSAVLLSPQYQEANQKYIEAKYEMDLTRYAVDSISMKKDALENLVRLHGQEYFAGPKMPRNLDSEWEEKARQKRSNTKVRIDQNEGMRRKRSED